MIERDDRRDRIVAEIQAAALGMMSAEDVADSIMDREDARRRRWGWEVVAWSGLGAVVGIVARLIGWHP